MKPTGLLVAVAVLVVLGGLVWWSNKKQATASKTSPDTATKLLSIPDDQFQEIRIKKLTGELQDLHRVNGKWQLTQPTQLSADPDTVGSMVSTLASLNADKLIEDKAADLQPYGLNIPTQEGFNEVWRLAQALAEQNFKLEYLEQESKSLERAFIELTQKDAK